MLPKNKAEIIQYLSNFWEHSIGDTLTDGKKRFKILKIDNQEPSQIKVTNTKDWIFIQDYSWSPTLAEATNSTCKSLGIKILPSNQLLKNKVFREVPKTFDELYDIIVEYRIKELH